MFEQLFAETAAKADAVMMRDASDQDYVKDGLLHCHECHTPKQVRLEMPSVLGGGHRVFGCLCKCGTERRDAKDTAFRLEQDKIRISRLREASLMDAKFYRSTFDSFVETAENARALKLCRRYADGFAEMEQKNQGLLFFGPVGTGKTYAAACIANQLLDQGVQILMTSFVRLMRIAYEGGDDWKHAAADIRNARLVVIDDLGAERSTDTALEHVYGIVDDRYRAGRPVIFTTNLKLDEMQRGTDLRLRRIYDRIFETCYPVELKGASMRVQQAAERFDAMRGFLEDAI